MNWKPLFSRAIAANPDRLHFAAHSHHLWPDASYDGQIEAWDEAARLADRKWDRVMGSVWEEGQRHIAEELELPDPSTIAFSANTHDFIVRIFSALPRPARVLATDGEFHSFRRQMARWVEDGDVMLETAPPDALAARAKGGEFDLIFASHILFNTGAVVPDLERLAALAKPEGPWVMLDCYHSFMAIPCDYASIADRVFLTGGGYKYAMAGEGFGWLHAPPGYAPRPAVTGWFAEFDDLMAAPGAVGYAPDARRFLGATFDAGGLYRFNAVRRMIAESGMTTAAVADHVMRLQHRFVSAAAMPGLHLVNPPGNAPQARFLAYCGPAAPPLYRALMDRNVYTDLRGQTIRIGFAAYHDDADVDRLTQVIAECVQRERA
jgi:selenocysteine lyase/cysteine desulfurase